jgi:hypothetical protein
MDDLELSLKYIALNKPSISGDKSVEFQEDTLDENLLVPLMLSL